MNHYEAVNILDMLNAIGEDAVKNILSDFSCPKNFEIESFVKQNALEFAKRKMSITYLVIDEEGQLAAIFALTHKAVQLTNEGFFLSKSDSSLYRLCFVMSNLSLKNGLTPRSCRMHLLPSMTESSSRLISSLPVFW